MVSSAVMWKIPQLKQASFAILLQKAYGFLQEKYLHTIFSFSLKLGNGPEAWEGKLHESCDMSGYLAIFS